MTRVSYDAAVTRALTRLYWRIWYEAWLIRSTSPTSTPITIEAGSARPSVALVTVVLMECADYPMMRRMLR